MKQLAMTFLLLFALGLAPALADSGWLQWRKDFNVNWFVIDDKSYTWWTLLEGFGTFAQCEQEREKNVLRQLGLAEDVLESTNQTIALDEFFMDEKSTKMTVRRGKDFVIIKEYFIHKVEEDLELNRQKTFMTEFLCFPGTVDPRDK